MIDHYSNLQVSSRAETEVIHAAYRALAKIYNTDPAKLKTLNESKTVLLDDKLRGEYDQELQHKSGKIIGQYRVIRKIAEGGFGITYLGEHITLGTPVCIKHASKVSPLDEQLMFEEARSIWDLRHFGMPSIRDIIKLPDGSVCLVMSYIPGMTLHSIVESYVKKKKNIDPEHVAWITERVLNVLRYLHFHGVVHGDVKPQNIIVQLDSHQVVLVDYGLSLVKPSHDSKNKGYTPFFAPPEQVAEDTLLPESDFYGLGMSMIFALGGDIESKSVPASTPQPMCDLIKRFVAYDVLSRPNWGKEDLCETIQRVRKDSFGRAVSNMKPLTM